MLEIRRWGAQGVLGKQRAVVLLGWQVHGVKWEEGSRRRGVQGRLGPDPAAEPGTRELQASLGRTRGVGGGLRLGSAPMRAGCGKTPQWLAVSMDQG